MTSVRLLLVDDYEPFRRVIVSRLQEQPKFLTIAEASDGLEAIQKANEIQPDLILLDIGLPKLNGIEAARQIRQLSPKSNILFVSECRSADIAEAALSTGALGYVVKSDGTSDLSLAVDTVLKGERFLSASLDGDDTRYLDTKPWGGERKIKGSFHPGFAEDTWISDSLKSLIKATCADFGKVQLLDSANRALRIVAQHGFQSEFLNYFDTVTEKHASVCGAALKRASRIVVQDVATDPLFTTESRGVLLRANVRSVQSTPLMDAGSLVGMVSTHYCHPNGITTEVLGQVDDFVASLLAKLHASDQKTEQSETYIGIGVDVTERGRVEEISPRLAAIVESSEDAIISKNLDGIITSWNAGAERIFGYTESEMLARPITILIPPDLREEENTILETLRSGGHIKHYETIRVTKAGKGVNVSLTVSPVKDSTGKVVEISKIARDISERKRGERSLAEMTRRLIEAQEQERSRIGRELHDDVNQRLAMLNVELERLQESPSGIQERVQELRKSVAELSNDVQALSHDLHSSKLEYLGVVAGMRSWCKEFAERRKMEIEYSSDVRGLVPLEVGRTLFRVLQEALNNASKHSAAKRVEVQLREDSRDIHLIVSDLGKGFDRDAALRGKGLGLTSMQERVRLVNGAIDIDSKPMAGTTIRVRVPLESAQVPAKVA